MSWVNDNPNVIIDYLMIDELFTRPLPLVSTPPRDNIHGRAATVLEEAIDNAFFNINVRNSITKYKDPQKCPADYLHRLAVENGVHGWYSGDSEQVRRDTIQGAKGIHRKAGTIEGLTESIESLGLDVVLSPSASSYTLTLISPTILTPELTRAVTDRVEIYKSLRDRIVFTTSVPATSKRFRVQPTLTRISYYSEIKRDNSNE